MCAMILYSNGLLEDVNPKNLVFTEEELLEVFNEFKEIKTTRVHFMLNTWGIYGIGLDPNDFNRIASDIARETIFSHILFVHDSEIDPAWNMTDTILYEDYNKFLNTIKKLIDDISANILKEYDARAGFENKMDHLPQLVTIGSTPDKKILFGFNPEDQTKEFYNNEDFYKFSQKVYEYITTNKQEKEPFTIYADKKAIIIVEPAKVPQFLTSILEKFKSKEDYEICTDITNIMNNWRKITTPARKSRKKANGEKTNGQ